MNSIIDRQVNCQYEELKTELAICRIGGLFLALYDDERTPQIIMAHLKKDLPNYFHYPIKMTEQKIWFPILFSQTYEPIGKQNTIFHVLEIEQLENSKKEDFIKYLQYGRERFKVKPYSIVFWVYPSFVRRLFISAPDFHHWIAGIYDFTKMKHQNREYLSNSTEESESDLLEKIDNYLKKTIWQYKHWDDVKNNGGKFLIEAMGRADLDKYYVKSYCIDINDKEQYSDESLDSFLADDEKSFMTLLGDFGTGKSSFALHYYIIKTKQYLLDKSQRIPIFITLKDYPDLIDIEKLIIQDVFDKKFDIPLAIPIFQDLALRGKFLFFLDGFDEMKSSSSEEKTIQNFKELTKLSYDKTRLLLQDFNPEAKLNKILLTCRTHYFLTDVQAREILKADYTVLYRNYATKKEYEIARITLKEFSSEQIEEYIFRSTKDQQQTHEFMKIINDTYNLKELSSRPLLLKMIITTLPKLKHQNNVNASNLYQIYTNDWITQEDWRSKMTPAGKREFMWNLAVKMFNKGNFTLHYSELDRPEATHLKESLNIGHHEDYYMYETTTCSFLNRDSDGNYKFIHKSFMEYFVAENFYSKVMNKYDISDGYKTLNKEIRYFLKLIIASENSLSKNFSQSNFSGFDLSHIDLIKIRLSFSSLINANLQGANLQNADLSSANLQSANLQNADLSSASLRGADFGAYASSANLQSANLQNADLSSASLRGADLSSANLLRANLQDTDLSDANLREANLYAANLKKTKLVGAYLKGSNLSATSLPQADFGLNDDNLDETNLEETNLSEINLSEVSLKNANLRGTKLRNANLKSADLRSANLTNADLMDADLNEADLSDSKLVEADLNRANLSKANLSRADLTRAFLMGANLSEAKLIETNLTEAGLTLVNLKGAYLTRANLTAVNLAETNLHEAADLSECIYGGGNWHHFF